MLKAQDLAKYIITKCNLDNKPISNLQLQKILYFVQGAFYYETGNPIFEDEIRAWDYGPVVECVYEKYKKYGSSSINDIDVHFEKVFAMENNCENSRKIVDIVVERLRTMDPWELVKISHEEGTPWANNYQFWWPAIGADQIEKYFKNNKEIFEKLGVDLKSSPKGTDTQSDESKTVLDFFNKLDELNNSKED